MTPVLRPYSLRSVCYSSGILSRLDDALYFLELGENAPALSPPRALCSHQLLPCRCPSSRTLPTKCSLVSRSSFSQLPFPLASQAVTTDFFPCSNGKRSHTELATGQPQDYFVDFTLWDLSVTLTCYLHLLSFNNY